VTPDHQAGADRSEGFLAGVTVVELADETGEYVGKLLAGLGANVIKVEPPGGEITRTYGPFKDNVEDPEQSLHFWHSNIGKRSVVLDLDDAADQARLRDVVSHADVFVHTRALDCMRTRGLDQEALRADAPGLIYCRISPFGDDGPWADYPASDLVHLALGGVAMNCGYDPEPSGHYDTPPIAPQMWQAYCIAGETTSIAIVTALIYRQSSGRGQYLSASIHDSVSKNTETDVPNWVYQRLTNLRQTCRHSMPMAAVPALALTKDGRWLLPYRTYLPGGSALFKALVDMLARHGMQADLDDPKYLDDAYRAQPVVAQHIGDVTDRLIGQFLAKREIWQEAQRAGMPWAPIRSPHENAADPHFSAREAFKVVDHPELGESYTYTGARWYCPEVPWQSDTRPPMLGEHTAEVFEEIATRNAPEIRACHVAHRAAAEVSPLGKPFALAGVRIVDLSWLLASAGAGRFLAAHGAEVVKVEHSSRWDTMRFGAGFAPVGGRAEREKAQGPIAVPPGDRGPNKSGAFMEINSGKLGVSLNLKSDEGKQILERLIADADMVIEGFSPGTMERMGFGYERLKQINPGIIYVQQSGTGEHGCYKAMRTYGPTAAAFAGNSEMSGMPAPFPPAGIGYSYLDWFGAYNMATAMLAALFRKQRTGLGCHIDASQIEIGIYLTGTAVLDHSVNGRVYERTGNRSPYKPAAPHGIYPTRGDDRWIALSSFTDEHWTTLIDVLNTPELGADARFGTLADRLAHQDELDAIVAASTAECDGYELMHTLASRRFPAGVCQSAQDRCENDPQLAHLGWLEEVPQSEIGTWPVRTLPVTFSETPSYIGGFVGRSGPNYGEDNVSFYPKRLGLTVAEVEELLRTGVF
jgi:crotonobetainyl-CoA:carnitine CoA-transferase CaiB-like acyl-CoA transferase